MAKLSLRGTAVLLSLFLLAACDDSGPWLNDDNFTFELLVQTPSYELIPSRMDELVSTITAVQIYKIEQSKAAFYPLRKLMRTVRQYETKDRRKIRNLLSNVSFRDAVFDDCLTNLEPYVFHVVVYDHELMRYGYFMISVCKLEGDWHAFIQYPMGNDPAFGTYFSYDAAQMLKRMHLLK